MWKKSLSKWTTQKKSSNNPLQFYKGNPTKNEGQRNRVSFTKEIPLNLATQKNQFLIIHFNFIWEIPLKMKDIIKIIHFIFTKEIPLNMNRPKKIWNFDFFKKRPLKVGEFWRSTLSTISKKFNLEGVFEFLYPDPRFDKN